MSKQNHKRRGNALIEFAIASAILLPAFFGSFHFGYSLYTYNVIGNGVANGARYASYRTYRAASANSVTQGKTAIQNMVVYGTTTPAQNSVPIVKSLNPSKVSVDYTLSATGVPMSVRVSINSFEIDTVFSKLKLTGKPSATYPFMGRYAPEESE